MNIQVCCAYFQGTKSCLGLLAQLIDASIPQNSMVSPPHQTLELFCGVYIHMIHWHRHTPACASEVIACNKRTADMFAFSCGQGNIRCSSDGLWLICGVRWLRRPAGNHACQKWFHPLRPRTLPCRLQSMALAIQGCRLCSTTYGEGLNWRSRLSGAI